MKFYSIFLIGMNINRFNPFTCKFKKCILPKRNVCGVVRIGDHLSTKQGVKPSSSYCVMQYFW